MKSKKTELDVDFIGGQGPLTKEEELTISEYIKKRKLLISKEKQRKEKLTATKKKVA